MLNEWRAAVLRSSLHPTTKLFCVVLADHMTEEGAAVVEHEVVASALGGLHVQRISERSKDACERGFLTKRRGGRGRANRYQAVLPSGVLGGQEALDIRGTRRSSEPMTSASPGWQTPMTSGPPGTLLKVTAQSNHDEARPAAATTVLGSGNSSPNPRPPATRRPRGRLGPRPAPTTATTDHQEIA